ncbi:MAG: hypothetical protein E6J02_01150 [Chloroflexi bacterium]|nr:MAG: hypothetical protein E6J02_01150 [Chloroflexota bacterium]TME16874.1 MAG: hypothetical protein E6I63_05080 [Chloroflexota bacterium]
MSKSKRKQQLRRDRRPVRRQSWYDRIPVLPVVMGSLVVIALAGVFVYNQLTVQASPTRPVSAIQCTAGEQAAAHYHAHLEIIYLGSQVNVPGAIGVSNPVTDQTTGYVTSGSCFYWLHTHYTDGIIHIEAPASAAKRRFTLGDFFDVWHISNSSVRLDSTHLATLTVAKGQSLKVIVDGKPYTGNPRNVDLGPSGNHTQITLEIAPPDTPQTPFTFPQGL